ncbi:type II secretion system protein [Granulosicoccaceae sp. 1_MG-2023]|nr:type II secretion system protein [Granulosicoccaceae sp. 1_MG-2023]
MKPVKRAGNAGFTLVELLIVVIILAVLASVAVPQFSSSTDDAKEAALDSTLAELRTAIELYYHQHGEYPGANSDGSNGPNSQGAFVSQLTRYTDDDGLAFDTKSDDNKYGPYLKKLSMPANPIDGKSVVTINTSGALNATGDGSGGWWFDTVSGKLMPNVETFYDR